MIAYHGTTDRRARKIAVEGFLPRKPSRRVWFAASKAYARHRAQTQARRGRARPVVLTCEIDLAEFRRKLGSKRVRRTSGIIAIDGPVPAAVLRSCGEPLDTPSTPKELADWVNRVLGLKPWKGVGQRHPGILRLSRWVVNRVQDQQRGIRRRELLHMARQWLPEFFRGVRIDPDRLIVMRRVELEPPEDTAPEPAADPREEEAVELLDTGGGRQRIRGLKLLAEIEDPDLFEWCAMYLREDSIAVRLAALHAMLRCEQIDPAAVAPLAASKDKRIRGAAIAVLARHGGEEAAERWFRRGLKDPEPCVRLETAAILAQLDPAEHRAVFRLALYDPNPKIARKAEKLIAGKGFPRMTWGRRPSHHGGK
jgi:hypothetical protein